ncbi:MAG: hypothetical protein ACE5K4_06335 [Candidatus Hydrothermarchaeota archaeon]
MLSILPAFCLEEPEFSRPVVASVNSTLEIIFLDESTVFVRETDYFFYIHGKDNETIISYKIPMKTNMVRLYANRDVRKEIDYEIRNSEIKFSLENFKKGESRTVTLEYVYKINPEIKDAFFLFFNLGKYYSSRILIPPLNKQRFSIITFIRLPPDNQPKIKENSIHVDDTWYLHYKIGGINENSFDYVMVEYGNFNLIEKKKRETYLYLMIFSLFTIFFITFYYYKFKGAYEEDVPVLRARYRAIESKMKRLEEEFRSNRIPRNMYEKRRKEIERELKNIENKMRRKNENN